MNKIPTMASTLEGKGLKQHISLFFSLFYFFPLYFFQGTERFGLMLVFALVGYCVFIVFYHLCFIGMKGRVSTTLRLFLAAVALTFAIYPGGSSLFCFVAFFAGYYLAGRAAQGFLLSLFLVLFFVAYTCDFFSFHYLAPAILSSTPLFFIGQFNQRQEIARILDRQKNQRIEQLSALAERERIARDMHDLLGHSLSSLALKSELADKLMLKGKNEQASEEIRQVAALAREALSDVRRAVTDMKQRDVEAQIRQCVMRLEQLGYDVTSEVRLSTVDARVESMLVMVVKEWTTNIMKHSSGNKISFVIGEVAGSIRLAITNSGRVEKIIPGNGIQGITTRVQSLGGAFAIDCNHQQVTMNLSVPNGSLSTSSAPPLMKASSG